MRMGRTGCGLAPSRVHESPEPPTVSDERNGCLLELGKGSEDAVMVTIAGKQPEEMDVRQPSTRELHDEYLERIMIRGHAKLGHGVCWMP